MAEYKTKEELYDVLNRMAAQLQANEALKGRIGQSDSAIGFAVTDLVAEFVIHFAKGQVELTTGSSAGCSVCVILRSPVLDGIFSGRQNAESAYTFGALSLRGSEYAAEGFLRYMRDLVVAYQAVTA